MKNNNSEIRSPIPSKEGEAAFKGISPRIKWGLYFAAWGGVIFATLATNPADLLGAPGFPIGLIALLPNGAQNATMAAWLLGPVTISIGWTVYAALTIVISNTKRVGAFLAIYIVFCILLALNTIGCRQVIEVAAGVH